MKQYTLENLKKMLLSASVLTICMGSALSAQTVIDATLDRRIKDSSGNGLGNELYTTSFFVGDSSNNNAVFGSAWEFDRVTNAAAIAAGGSILFQVEVAGFIGDPHSLFSTLSLYSVNSPDDVLGFSDFDVGNNTYIGDFNASSTIVGSIVSFDVTAYVQAAASNNVSFIMKVKNPDNGALPAVNNGNSTGDIYEFVNNSGQLVVSVPEPSTSALLIGLLSVVTIAGRRRSRSA